MPLPRRPDFLFIVADDLGYADLGCYAGRGFDGQGCDSVSPVLDGLAANGLRFSQGYSNSPVCSPTRVAMMSARWQYRLRAGLDEPIRTASRGSAVLGMPPTEPSLPSMLRAVGYRTALVGKWHLGYPPHFSPLRSGYETFFGPMSGGLDYFTHRSSSGVHDLYEGESEVETPGYMTDLLSQRAVAELQGLCAGNAPFLLSLHYTAPHWPWETRDDADVAPDVARNLFHLDGGNIHSYRRMIHHMDEGIGQVVDTLRAAGRLDNTVIVFTSDNGGERFSDNWPLVGGKMDLTEGGIRVPYIVHWPQGIARPGRVSAQHCLTMDWSATLLALGGANPPAGHALDGVDLSAALRDEAPFARPMYWRMLHRGQRALRDGAWKYLRVDGHDYLFDITADERERANRADREPGRLAAMRRAWEDWNASLPPVPSDATVSPGYGPQHMPQR